jgi:DNA-binding CsgD family transcriptional regulator
VEKMHRSSRPAGAGFILTNAEGKPLYANAKAKTIVTYPEGPRRFPSAWAALMRQRIFTPTGKQSSSLASSSHVEFLSGRRKYVGLAIRLAKWRRPPAAASVAVVLERNDAASRGAAEVSKSFRLTERERGVVEHLIQGLTNKEIAGRMNISPNTVRAFIRMVMGKLGVSTRSGIVGIVFRGIYTAGDSPVLIQRKRAPSLLSIVPVISR